jgi:hypothetical protein
MTVLAAAAEQREAGPIGLVVILCLLVALIFLIRSMNKHLRKVPSTGFSREATPPTSPTDPAPGTDGN